MVGDVDAHTLPTSDVYRGVPGKIDRYQLLEPLGKGAHGTVHRALDRTLGREVAFKVISSHVTGEDLRILRDRFRREAEIVARLDHPHIVPLFDHGDEAGSPWMVQKLYAGGDLAARLRQPVAPRQAAIWVRDLADAVAEAHHQGVLHRDIKPSNVLLDEAGRVFLGDFGIARSLNDAATGFTREDQALGSPGYMAPEQARGGSAGVGPAADIHGLGALLYHALTGLPPYKGNSVASTLRQVIELDPLPPRRLNPTIPADLENVCLKCLEKDPARRYRNARELRDDLDRFQNGQAVRAQPSSAAWRTWKWFQRRPVVSGLALALALSLSGGVLATSVAWVRLRTALERQRQSRDELAFELVEKWGQEPDPRRGLDTLSAILTESPGHVAAMRRAWSTLDQRQLPVPLMEAGPDNCLMGAFDSSGSRIVLLSAAGRLVLMDAEDGHALGEHTLPDIGPDPKFFGLGFSPRGDHVWLRGEDQRVRAWHLPDWRPLAGEVPPEWTPPPKPLPAATALPGYKDHQLSPDGCRAMVRCNDRDYSLIDTATGQEISPANKGGYMVPGWTVFPRAAESRRFLTWSLDKLLIHNAVTGALEGAPVSLGKPIEFGCWHPAGHRILAIPLQGRPVLFELGGPPPSVPSRVLTSPIASLTYSPDNRFLSVATRTGGVYVLATGTLQRVEPAPPVLAASRWSAWIPQGLLAVTEGGRACLIAPDSTSAPVLFEATGPLAGLAVSRDHRWIATLSTGGALELRSLSGDPHRPMATRSLSLGSISAIPGRTNGVSVFAFNARASYLALAINSGRAEAWSVPDLQPIVLSGCGGPATGGAWHPSENRFLLTEMTGGVWTWNVEEGANPKATALPELPFVGRAAFDDQGRHLILAVMGGRSEIRQWPPSADSRPRLATASAAWQIATVPGEESFVVACQDGTVEVRSLPQALVQVRWKLPTGGVPNFLACSGDGTRIAVGKQDTVYELSMPPGRDPVPTWFVEWLEASGQGAIDLDPHGPRSAVQRILGLRSRMETLTGGGFWADWGRSQSTRHRGWTDPSPN